MTQDEIIKLARETLIIGPYESETGFSAEAALKFAKLIIKSLKPSLQTEFEKMFMEGAAAERKQIIDMAESSEFNRIRGEFSPTFKDLVQAIKAREQA
jgi:hypothetical protein